MSEWLEELHSEIRDLPTLLALLSALLDAIHLLPPQYRRYNTRTAITDVHKHIGRIQRLLLTQILPIWDTLLSENDALSLVEQFFCPNGFVNSSSAAGNVAISAYATFVSSPFQSLTSPFALRILGQLSKEYPIDRLHTAVYTRTDLDQVEKDVCWEDTVRNVCAIPAKVANALGDEIATLPDNLENAIYFNNLSARCEVLISTIPSPSSSIAYLLSKLVNVGVFPAHPPISRSQPSFFQTTLATIRTRSNTAYSKYWASLFLILPSSLTLQSILASLFASLRVPATNNARVGVRQEAAILSAIVGKLSPETPELWEIAMALITSRKWEEYHARIFVCWVSGGSPEGASVDLKVLNAFLEAILDVWSSSEHIKHSIISQHRYMTALLLITVSYFSKPSPYILELASTSAFINAISIYISHLDASVRRCGMLAAEVVAHLCDKKLDFGEWEGDDYGKSWCRTLRTLLEARDVDAPLDMEDTEEQGRQEPAEESVSEEIASLGAQPSLKEPSKIVYKASSGYDSDDSMTGYASPPSSRSVSPSPSELADIEKDPTLNVGVKKVPRPVYLAQLGDLFRGGSSNIGPDDPHEADRIEMALNTAEELIRKKKGFGTELDENAVNLVFALLSLQDNFDLEDFSEKRQGALNALVAGAPRKATPALIQEFFKNQYSADQRFVVLNAIAIGARELASLPVPESRVAVERTVFPSKRLPAPLHRKYISANTDLVSDMVDDLSKKALEPQRAAAATSDASEFVRERRLRIQKTAQSPRVVEIVPNSLNPFSSDDSSSVTRIAQPKTRFIDVAAEFFIIPLIGAFWEFLRDEQAREERTSHREGRGRYHGAGTGLILNPLVLSQFVRTLAILANASVNAPEWLAVIAPDALELALTIGTRPMSHMDVDEEEGITDQQSKEASLLTSTLELALVIIDGALEIDGGRILGLEHTTLVLGVEEWAGKIFSNMEKGLKLEGGGGAHEVRLSRAAAGMLLKVDELTSKWRRSMLDTR